MKKILVIEDQKTEELDYDSLFSATDFTAYIAFNKYSGFDIALRYHPDLIICNLELETDGIQLIEKLVHFEQTQNIPIIYLSSISDFKNQRKIMNCGADDYLVKPFCAEDLILAIESRLNKQMLLKEKMMDICRESLEAESQLPNKDDHILVTIGKRLQLVKYEQICCITALKEYSKIRTFDGQNIVIRKSLKSWVDMLPAKGFLRIHRSSIINVEAIEKIKKIKDRSYVVFLRSVEEPLELSQRYASIMRRTFPS